MTIWKLSMGPGAYFGEFKNVLLVFDWLRQGLVLVHKDTGSYGSSPETQGEKFIHDDRDRDYFYLCHGNQTPSIILFGKFTGPAIDIPKQKGWKRTGWAGRKFEWIVTSVSPKRVPGKRKGWTPKHNIVVTFSSHFPALFSWRIRSVLGDERDRAPARSLFLSGVQPPAAEIRYRRAKYRMTFENWLDEREAGDCDGEPRCSGWGRAGTPSGFYPLCNLALCQHASAENEWLNPYTSMRLFTTRSGRVLPRHLTARRSPTSPGSASVRPRRFRG